MDKRHAFIEDLDGSPMEADEVVLWGNNAAWLCVQCSTLLGDRTGDGDFEVTCENCGAEYQILREGDQNLARSEGVRRIG